MHQTRDLCWLARQVENIDISTYFLSTAQDTVLMRTLERELGALFKGISRSEQADASITFWLEQENSLEADGYRIEKEESVYHVKSASERGLIYGMFALHRLLIMGQGNVFPCVSIPAQSIRMINHWDNFDGSIERGYAGDSIFYDNNSFRGDMELIRQYARLLASVGLNAVSINNVNVHRQETFFIKEPQLLEIKKIADVFAEYGINMFLSINYAVPMIAGNLSTADPLDPAVIEWWEHTASEIYRVIPDFAGFVVKADSEGEPGPFTYQRNHDEGANMLAKVLKPYGGLVIWRCFVYNCAQDWRDRNLDRARASYDIFMKLDGCFEDNAVLQIKNGPIDFQIREPISPLFGALKKTNQMVEFQITQEYTGHQKDICYLVPMWKETLDFETGYEGESAVKTVIREYSPSRSLSGVAAVGNVGMDNNWTGNKLAQANLFGYGRLVWDNSLSSRQIAAEWVRLSFQLEESREQDICEILITSRETYENYTCPLAVGFMCKPSIHYGVDIDGYEYEHWGTYHYADRNGVGRERTETAGTGYTRQYSDRRFNEYEDLSTCPDELLLFFHHVPYTHVLHSGKTVIQHIYDTHFDGVENVEKYQKVWESLRAVLDGESFLNVKERLELQRKNAIEWRDQVNTYFYRKSGVEDKRGRKIYD